jgi:hypothetical protein
LKANIIREKLFRFLKHHPVLKETLRGNRKGAILSMEPGPKADKFVSADLTAATDRISHELALALWEGFAQIGVLSYEDVEVLRYCLGPQRMVYSDGS